MTRPRLFTPFDWIMAIGTLILLALIIWFCFILARPAGAVAANLTAPAANSVLGASADFSGTGQPGSQLRLFLQDRELTASPIAVGADGNWTLPAADIAALGLNPGTYNLDLRSVDSTGAALGSRSFPFRVEAAAAPADITIATPANDSEVEAGAFELSGTGRAGETLEVYEDGALVANKVVVGADGNWTVRVPNPAGSNPTYAVRRPGQTAGVEARYRIAAATGTAAACTADYTLLQTLTDGSTVTAPFRFGGEGKDGGYRVVVRRDGREIGRKDLPLDNTCGWGYLSRPGTGTITYEVRGIRAPDSDPPLSTITLTVR